MVLARRKSQTYKCFFLPKTVTSKNFVEGYTLKIGIRWFSNLNRLERLWKDCRKFGDLVFLWTYTGNVFILNHNIKCSVQLFTPPIEWGIQ